MWQALAAWCAAQRPALQLADLRGTRLLRYLASRQGLQLADGALTPRYQRRLVSLVQRVQAHHSWQQQQAAASPTLALAMARGTVAHAARAPLLDGNAAGVVDPPLHLQPRQIQALIAALCSSGPDAAGRQGARWQAERDRCAAALQLGAGLGPGDVRALRLADVRPPTAGALGGWRLQVAASGSAPAHPAPLAAWAAGLLSSWLTRRAAEGLGGPWLLPSTRSGKPWGKVAQYEAARRVIASAGLDPDGGGSFRLRHSFALRQLHHGHPADLVAAWLGITDAQVMARYLQVLAAWAPAAPAPAEPAPWPV